MSGSFGTWAVLREEPFAEYTRQFISFSSSSFNPFVGSSPTLAAMLPLTTGYMCYDLGLMALDREVHCSLCCTSNQNLHCNRL